MYLVYYEVCISISLFLNGYYYIYYYIYLEIASFYQMFGIGIFVSITVCDITGQ